MMITARTEFDFTTPASLDDAWQGLLEEISSGLEGKRLPNPCTAQDLLRLSGIQIYKLVPMSYEEFADADTSTMDLLKERADELNAG